jgi:hypothetical protein
MRIGAVAAAVSVAGVAPAQSPLAMHGPRILEVQRDARISAAQLAEARAKLNTGPSLATFVSMPSQFKGSPSVRWASIRAARSASISGKS